MKNRNSRTAASSRRSAPRRRGAGFTLIELMIAMAVFLIITGAAVGLFRQHAPRFNQQQNMVALNMSMRNALAQMQIDVVNAGSGYYPGQNIASWPIGITVVNHNAGGCFDSTAYTYGPACFDELRVMSADPAKPAAHAATGAGGVTLCQGTTSASTPFLLDAGYDPTTGLPMSLTDTAAAFQSGNEVLLMSSDGHMTTLMLTGNASVSGGKVQLPHAATNSDGTNTSANDPLGISTSAVQGNVVNYLASNFCTDAWLVKLTSTRYHVDATDPTNPKLRREQPTTLSDTGGEIIAEQIIGFKVGVALRQDDASNMSTVSYFYDPANYTDAGNWSLIRSVRVTAIGRTSPNRGRGPNVSFKNSYDQGPYEIEALSVVINPRALSMRDN